MKKQSIQAPVEIIRVDRSRLLFSRIHDYFVHHITPLYGDQKNSLAKIYEGSDRVCELFQDPKSEEDLGFIVYKTWLSNEFTELGFSNTLEIKTLFVVNAKTNSGRRVASKMLLRIAEYAISHSAEAIAVTVSSGKAESLAFFLYSGFKIEAIKKNFYVHGLDEFFLFHSNPKSLVQYVRKKILEKPSASKLRNESAITILEAVRNQRDVSRTFEGLANLTRSALAVNEYLEQESSRERSISGNGVEAFI